MEAILIFFISFFYSIPSVVLYFLTIFIVLKYRKSFDSSFFTLYVYDGLMNLFTYFVGFYMMRLSSITCEDCLFSFLYRNTANYFPMNFLTAMSYHMAYVQYSTTALISFNRLSVLWNYSVMEPIWNRYSWLIGFVVFALPFLDTHRCFYYKTGIDYFPETRSYGLVTPMPISQNFYYLTPAMSIFTIISVGVNLLSLCIVRNLKTQKKEEVETNFIIIMTITCVVQFFGCCLSVARVILETHPIAKTLVLIVPFVSDGLTLVQPWLLVFFSGPMRTKIMGMLKWKDTSSSPVVVRSLNV